MRRNCDSFHAALIFISLVIDFRKNYTESDALAGTDVFDCDVGLHNSAQHSDVKLQNTSKGLKIRQRSGAPYRLEIEGEFWANSDNAVDLLDEVINIENRPCGERGGDIECA